MAKKNKKWAFGWILVFGAILITWLCSEAISALVSSWNWPLNDIRYTMNGKRVQSAFAMLSLITGILGGLCLANYYQRKDWMPKLFLVPFLSTFLSILELRFFQLMGLPLESSTSYHFAVIFLWLIHIFSYFWINKKRAKNPRSPSSVN